jgi:eukaryotic-like serine/threonine-protein kinase
VGNGELDRRSLRPYYALAQAHESHGELREAVDLYEKILACDYHFEDVGARLQAAKARLAEAKRGRQAARTSRPRSPRRKGATRYQILSELGRGGMGIVYKASDTVLDRVVAFKVLPDALKENPQALKNFLREAKSAAQLNHPNIVTVYDAGEQDGRYYIAMEYVDGNTLKEIVRRRGAIAPGGVLHVLVQMCEALAYAHEKKIVHRDIKTANTMWTRDRKAKIMDFGLAKVIEEVRNHTTLVSGTPYYMSPEQTLGRNVDYRTDIYSLGVTVFELATAGCPSRRATSPTTTSTRRRPTRARSTRRFRRCSPESLRAACARTRESATSPPARSSPRSGRPSGAARPAAPLPERETSVTLSSRP